MLKFLMTSFLILVMAAPALAKPKNVYPVSCNDLWAAVKDSLDNRGNYGIISINDAQQKASFVVVGNLIAYTDKVTVTPAEGGCLLNATILEVGSDDGDWRQFHHRVEKSLAKLQAAKPKAPTSAAGQP